MKTSKSVELDVSVYTWYIQQRSCGNSIRGAELAASAVKLARQLGMDDFHGSDGWLWRFRNRRALRNLDVTGEADSADVQSVEPFCLQLLGLIKNENLFMSQIYNVDETDVMCFT